MAHAQCMLNTYGFKYTFTLFNVFAFPLQQRLHEDASVLRYMYICLVNIHNRLFLLFAERKVALYFDLRVSVLYTEITSDPF
jgi:hypothetical protein